ncbi:hypothetical protein NQ318_006040 [Aromia moschata]|uniref:Histone deacetylase n=1 Tax=Aromia moschata TaxID=1265417 RepID=A0AAV8Z2K7_9CUCU|nr:hypothetical protein NQ318_006040 [Aromia moschata]
MATQPHSRKRVCYYYDSDIGNYYYGQGHPMKPHRIPAPQGDRRGNDEISLGRLYSILKIDQTGQHVGVQQADAEVQRRRGLPVFDGLYEFCQLSAGGSVAAAVKLNKQASEICINWGGGLHHAKKSEASGFCYVNDIVLGILELLKYHQRVLYIDIDVHHGDGVEEAFYTTDRVMTVSFHKYGEYFPGTGDLRDIGAGKGKYYAVNIPLRDGMDDEAYESIFVPIISKVMETFQPSAVVLQCGADSLTGDRLGCFNLTVKGHGKCVEFVKKYNLPFMMVGGGGYTIRNVSRAWTYETSVALGVEIANELPYNDYFDPSNMANQNTPEYLEKIKTRLFENLRMLPHAPGVQVQAIPEDAINEESDSEDKADKDERLPQKDLDKRIVPENEFSDSEDEGEGGRRDNRSYKGRKRPRLDKGGESKEGADDKIKEEIKSEKGEDGDVKSTLLDPKKDTGPAP